MDNLSPERRALLALRLRKKREEDAQERIPRRKESNLVPLSFAQQRLWFIDQIEPANTAYNLLAALRLTGSLDVAAVLSSFNEIIRRHEVLRTTFA
jgi:hypothetical protein